MMSTFIGCDWGTTSFRLRWVERGTRRVIAEQSEAAGIKAFASAPEGERAAMMQQFLAERIAMWPEAGPKVPFIVSGMASSSVGWRELPYARAPFALDGSDVHVSALQLPDGRGGGRLGLLVSGVRTDDDIMRGEESVLVGVHALHPELARLKGQMLFLLIGTHPKHVIVSGEKLISFRTYLTGELFDIITRDSLLAGSVTRDAAHQPPLWDDFLAGAACARERGMEAALFQVRTRHLLQHTGKPANTWFLSGIVIGAELAELARQMPRAKLCLVGDESRLALYRAALRAMDRGQVERETHEVILGAAVTAGQEQILHQHEASFGS